MVWLIKQIIFCLCFLGEVVISAESTVLTSPVVLSYSVSLASTQNLYFVSKSLKGDPELGCTQVWHEVMKVCKLSMRLKFFFFFFFFVA